MTNNPMYQCEQCGDEVAESDATLDTERGYREIVTLAFCPDCTTRQ